MGKKRVEDYRPNESMEAQDVSEVTTPEEKAKEPVKRMEVKKTCKNGDTIHYDGATDTKLVTKTYFAPGATEARRTKVIDVTKIKEPEGTGRDKTYVTFSNGHEYIKYLVSHRGYQKA